MPLRGCTLDPSAEEDQDEEERFIELFRHNQVVTELHCCHMVSQQHSFCSKREQFCKEVIIRGDTAIFGQDEFRYLAQALPCNKGIDHLAIDNIDLSEENWSLLFRSLTTHPRIKLVSLILARYSRGATAHRSLPADGKRTVMNAILQMLHLNTVVQTIHLPDAFNNEELYQDAIIPRLEMNRTCFEVQRQAVKRADPSIRPQLLGRALYVVRYNPALVFLFLSENVPTFVRTEEEEDSGIPLENNPAIISGKKRKAP